MENPVVIRVDWWFLRRVTHIQKLTNGCAHLRRQWFRFEKKTEFQVVLDKVYDGLEFERRIDVQALNICHLSIQLNAYKLTSNFPLLAIASKASSACS